MPNQFMVQQCQNVEITIRLFEKALSMSAANDDGTISNREARAIEKIKATNDKYIKEITKIINNI